jgi:7-keto-8-aminopelargonate synthetase-like enzyme
VLNAAGLPVMLGETHIVPVMVGDPEKCKQASDLLLAEHGSRGDEAQYLVASTVGSDALE